MRRFTDLTGKKFGKLEVIDLNGTVKGRRRWNCICDCGNKRIVFTASLNAGLIYQCEECGRKSKSENAIKVSKSKPGYSKTQLYMYWLSMRQRCFYPKTNGYKNYGGRGITVCEEWRNNFENFRNWALSNGYKVGLTLDRIDPNDDYCPDNCRWATIKEQSNNKRNNHVLELNGEKHTISEWSEITGINKNTILSRVVKYGWSAERALTEKPKFGGNNGNCNTE